MDPVYKHFFQIKHGTPYASQIFLLILHGLLFSAKKILKKKSISFGFWDFLYLLYDPCIFFFYNFFMFAS